MIVMKRIINLLRFIKNVKSFLCRDNLYPEELSKSKMRIFLEQIYFILKYGNFEPHYYNYGLNRKSHNLKYIQDNYLLPFRKIQDKIYNLNDKHPKYGFQTGGGILDDKFYFYLFLKSLNFPTPSVYIYIKENTLLYINPEFANSNLSLREILKKDMNVFVKKVDGMNGANIFHLKTYDNEVYINSVKSNMSSLLDILSNGDYIIQEKIIQHDKISEINGTSINTIRLQTINNNGEIICFNPAMRIGRNNSITDNWSTGGVILGIDQSKGVLMEYGFIKYPFARRVKEHPDSNFIFSGFEIPFFDKAVSLSIQLHKILYRCHSIGWDIAITQNGPVFIEANRNWVSSIPQTVHGGIKYINKYLS